MNFGRFCGPEKKINREVRTSCNITMIGRRHAMAREREKKLRKPDCLLRPSRCRRDFFLFLNHVKYTKLHVLLSSKSTHILDELFTRETISRFDILSMLLERHEIFMGSIFPHNLGVFMGNVNFFIFNKEIFKWNSIE